MKKLDRYIIKTFFGPFLFIFSILFFIFTFQLAWSKLSDFAGKGLSMEVIFRMISLLGVQFIPLIIPLTILLSAIMTFGSFGEKYELAAMKSTGISLSRIMAPLFFLTCIISLGVFYMADTVVPQAEKKARNLFVNVVKSKPALQIREGFFTEIPGFHFKIREKYGEDGNRMRDIFIQSKSSSREDQQTIRAKDGLFKNSPDRNYLILELFNGEYYIQQKEGKNLTDLQKQPLVSAQFDTLIQYIDVSEIMKKNLDEQDVSNYYRFFNTQELFFRTDSLDRKNQEVFTILADRSDEIYGVRNTSEKLNNKSSPNHNLSAKKTNLQKITQWAMDTLSYNQQTSILNQMKSRINNDITTTDRNEDQISSLVKEYAKHKFKGNENMAFPVTCILFFLIGAPLGAIIRKGGIGLPVVAAIVVFVIYYLLYTLSRNLSKGGVIESSIGAWIPNLIMLPLGIYLTYNALNDSESMNLQSYTEPVKNYFSKLFKIRSKEHERYQ